MLKRGWVAGMVVLAVAFAVPAVTQAATESLVTSASPTNLFPQNKQNEPAIAVDPKHPSVLASGVNEEIDEPPCDGNNCPFAQGIGNSGIYFSFDGGTTWTQPTYQGYSGRDGTLGTGDIGTLPHYDTAGLVSDGDPGVAFGPRRKDGVFRWRNGSRLYYSNLASNFSTVRSESTFRGFEAIAISHANRLHAAASDDASAWSDPVIVTRRRQSQTTFSDKPAIAVDTARTSPHFGSVYSCYSRFNSQNPIGPIKIGFSHSTDGGNKFSKPIDLSAAASQPTQDGRQGCSVATDSQGVVYVAWEDIVHKHSVFKLAKSFNGGRSFRKPRVVAAVTDVGVDDQVRSFSFDGIAGARTSSFPSLSIANGAPSGRDAPDTLALGWSDASDGLNHEHALVQLSGNGGKTWNGPTAVEESGDRPDFAFLGISPNGTDLYVTYDGFTDPFRNDTTSTRRFQGVVRHANVSGSSLSGLSTLDRGATGDSRASSANSLVDEFIGDYNSVAATNAGAVAVYNDARDAAVCGPINDYRQEIVDTGAGSQFEEEDGAAPPGGGTLPEAPAPGTDCPAKFGNTDIYSAAVADPTP
jgi:hypothetical protein